jgi:hypothetical protein
MSIGETNQTRHAGDDLHYRLRDRSQRLWVTGQDLLDNLLFREAADCIDELVKELNISRMANVVMDNGVAELESKLAKTIDVGNKMANAWSIKGNYYIPNVVAEWEAVLAELEK